MAIQVKLEPKTTRTVGRHYVYAKGRWSQSWVYIPWLFADEVSWRLAPGVGSACLSWHFGMGMRQGETQVGSIRALDGFSRLFIKIEFWGDVLPGVDDQNFGVLTWYGTCEIDSQTALGMTQIPDDDPDNWGQAVPIGLQNLDCLELAQTFYRPPILSHRWLASDGSEKVAGRAEVFNGPNAAGAKSGNRSTNKGTYAYHFSSQVSGDDKFWSTRTIVEYLANYYGPRNGVGNEEFTVLMDETAELLLPDWDKPVIDPHGQTTGDLFDVLMPRSRMLSWKLNVESIDVGGESQEIVRVVPISLFENDVSNEDGNQFKKNRRQLLLQTTRTSDMSPDIDYSLRESDIQQIDQVRVRGASRTSTCTLSWEDGTLEKGWSQELEDEYNAGASERAGYDDLSTAQQERWNDDARASDRLAPVFRRFQVVADWDGVVLDGLGGEDGNPVFLEKDEDLSSKRLVNPRELTIAPTLALEEGKDYRDLGTPSNPVPAEIVSEGPHARLAALVLFKEPDSDGVFGEGGRYVQVEKIGLAAEQESGEDQPNFAWSGRVEIPEQDRAVLVHVHGQPQHVIAVQEFEPLETEDAEGLWDWQQGVFTVTLLDDRDAEGVWPENNDINLRQRNLKRELVIYAGDEYRKDWLVPQTVIGVNQATGELLRCANGGWIQDDTKILRARAKQIHEYFKRTRRSLALVTRHITNAIRLGDYIVSIGYDPGAIIAPREVGSVVSEITLTIPGGENPGAATIKYLTEFAELDEMELFTRGR